MIIMPPVFLYSHILNTTPETTHKGGSRNEVCPWLCSKSVAVVFLYATNELSRDIIIFFPTLKLGRAVY